MTPAEGALVVAELDHGDGSVFLAQERGARNAELGRLKALFTAVRWGRRTQRPPSVSKMYNAM